MFKRRNRKLRIFYIISDFIMTSLAFFIFNLLRFDLLNLGEYSDLTAYLESSKIVLEQILIPLVLMCTYLLSGYYNRPFPRSRLSEFAVTSASAAVNAFIILMTIMINDPAPRRRTEYLLVFLLFIILLFLTYLGRISITTLAAKYAKRSKLVFKSIIIGNSRRGARAAKFIMSAKSLYENKIVGVVPLEGEHSAEELFSNIKVIKREDLKSFCIKEKVSQIVIAPEISGDKAILSMVNEFIDLDIPIKIAPDDLDYAIAGIRTNEIMGNALIDLTTPRISDFSQNLKRCFDILTSIILLLILSPFLIIISILIKIDSKGSAFYSQERIGKHRKPFLIYKFRTMRMNAEANGPRLSSDNDTRITKIGKYLRKYRIDELPQLLNVLLGQMSIVGPRPEREFYIREIVKKVPYYSLVYQVRPGITSWAMVKFGYASSVDQMVERTKFDMIYINNMSLLLDLKILIYTIRTVLTGEGK